MNFKTATHFYTATDTFLDSNKMFSVCKECCNEIYNNFFANDKSMDKTLLRMCRLLNVRFDERTLEATKQQIETYIAKDMSIENVFGMYKSKLLSTQKTQIGERNAGEDYTFEEPFHNVLLNPLSNTDDNSEYLKQFWGDKFEVEEYIFLENELSEWKKTHRCDTKAEESLLKELCHKELEIRKARNEDRATGNLVKELQDLMKTASVDPSKTSSSNAGKNQDTFSSFIKIIEQNEPADYYKDKDLFKNFDNIDWYFRKYVTRPLKNFIIQSRDFNVSEEDNNEEEDNVEDIIDEE
jgi:hypothetical protein